MRERVSTLFKEIRSLCLREKVNTLFKEIRSLCLREKVSTLFKEIRSLCLRERVSTLFKEIRSLNSNFVIPLVLQPDGVFPTDRIHSLKYQRSTFFGFKDIESEKIGSFIYFLPIFWKYNSSLLTS